MGQINLTDHHETECAQYWHNLVPPTPFSEALQLLSLLGLFLGQLLPVLTFQPLPKFSVLLPLFSFAIPHLLIATPLLAIV